MVDMQPPWHRGTLFDKQLKNKNDPRVQVKKAALNFAGLKLKKRVDHIASDFNQSEPPFILLSCFRSYRLVKQK